MLHSSTHTVFLALGSNLGDRQKNMEAAYQKIEERIGNIVSKSALYYTEPVGFESENKFVNAVCEVETNLNVHAVLKETQQIEKEIGRNSKSENQQYEDRILDIDILLFGNLIVEEPDLIVPHPRFHLRDFVLTPFAEIAPHTVHPVFDKSILQLKKELNISNGCVSRNALSKF